MNKHITVSLTETADRLAGNSLRPMHTVRIIAIPTARCLCLPKTSLEPQRIGHREPMSEVA
jgi:hypothetical protein